MRNKNEVKSGNAIETRLDPCLLRKQALVIRLPPQVIDSGQHTDSNDAYQTKKENLKCAHFDSLLPLHL
jgi:hypothetical protein